MKSFLLMALEPEYLEIPQKLIFRTEKVLANMQNPNYRAEFWKISDVKLS